MFYKYGKRARNLILLIMLFQFSICYYFTNARWLRDDFFQHRDGAGLQTVCSNCSIDVLLNISGDCCKL